MSKTKCWYININKSLLSKLVINITKHWMSPCGLRICIRQHLPLCRKRRLIKEYELCLCACSGAYEFCSWALGCPGSKGAWVFSAQRCPVPDVCRILCSNVRGLSRNLCLLTARVSASQYDSFTFTNSFGGRVNRRPKIHPPSEFMTIFSLVTKKSLPVELKCSGTSPLEAFIDEIETSRCWPVKTIGIIQNSKKYAIGRLHDDLSNFTVFGRLPRYA